MTMHRLLWGGGVLWYITVTLWTKISANADWGPRSRVWACKTLWSAYHLHEWKFVTTHVCRVGSKYPPQPITCLIQSFRIIRKLLTPLSVHAGSIFLFFLGGGVSPIFSLSHNIFVSSGLLQNFRKVTTGFWKVRPGERRERERREKKRNVILDTKQPHSEAWHIIVMTNVSYLVPAKLLTAEIEATWLQLIISWYDIIH